MYENIGVLSRVQIQKKKVITPIRPQRNYLPALRK